MAPHDYSFRTMTADDLPTIRERLAEPHDAARWGNAAEQFAPVSGDLGHPAMRRFIVAADDRPFAYLQCYDPAAWPQGGLGVQPVGTCGIDQFIGDPAMIEQGHGSAFIRAFVDSLLKNGAPRVVTEPNQDNARAIRAYEKAGFHDQALVDT